MAGTINPHNHLPTGPIHCLNEVRPRWPEQFGSETVNFVSGIPGLNEVRPRWPEQSYGRVDLIVIRVVSMKSGLDGRNNNSRPGHMQRALRHVSMKSGLDGRNNGVGAIGVLSVDWVSQ